MNLCVCVRFLLTIETNLNRKAFKQRETKEKHYVFVCVCLYQLMQNKQTKKISHIH